MRSLMIRLVVVALIGVGVTACQPAPPSCSQSGCIESRYTGSGPKVVILGDSLTVQTRLRLHQLLGADHAVKIASWYGEGYAGGPMSDWLIANGYTTRPMMLTAEDEYAPDNPNVAVLALGTNDAWLSDISAQQAIAAANEMLSDFGCVVAVTDTTHSTADGYANNEAAQINAAVTASAQVVVDWDAITRAHPEYVMSDSIHSTPAGIEARAQAIDAAVDSCTAPARASSSSNR